MHSDQLTPIWGKVDLGYVILNHRATSVLCLALRNQVEEEKISFLLRWKDSCDQREVRIQAPYLPGRGSSDVATRDHCLLLCIGLFWNSKILKVLSSFLSTDRPQPRRKKIKGKG